MLSQSEGLLLTDVMNDHGLEQMVHFPTQEKNTMDLILTTLPGQFQDVPAPMKKPRRKVYLYQKGDYESMRKDTLMQGKKVRQ